MIHVRANITAKDFVSQREYKRAMVDVNQGTGLYWQTKQQPNHWKPDAKTKYGHKQRSAKYLKRKLRMYAKRIRDKASGRYVQLGGQVDNVFTGRMKEQLSRSSVIRAYPTRVTVTQDGPRYMTMRVFEGNRKQAAAAGWKYGKGKRFSAVAGQQPDKTKEIQTTTREERDELAAIADKLLEQKAVGW